MTIRGGSSFNDDCSDLHHKAQDAALKILGQSYSFQANQAEIFYLRILFPKCSSCSSNFYQLKQNKLKYSPQISKFKTSNVGINLEAEKLFFNLPAI